MSAALQKPSSTFARVLSSTIGCVSELDGPPATGLGVPDEEDVEDEALVVGLAAGCAEPPEPLPHPVRTTVSTAPAPTTPTCVILFRTMVMHLLGLVDVWSAAPVVNTSGK
jgi:hypothetical protein